MLEVAIPFTLPVRPIPTTNAQGNDLGGLLGKPWMAVAGFVPFQRLLLWPVSSRELSLRLCVEDGYPCVRPNHPIVVADDFDWSSCGRKNNVCRSGERRQVS